MWRECLILPSEAEGQLSGSRSGVPLALGESRRATYAQARMTFVRGCETGSRFMVRGRPAIEEART